MKSSLEIIADSWPFAFVTIAFFATVFGLYIARWMKKSDEQDKAYRANQAVVVRDSNHG